MTYGRYSFSPVRNEVMAYLNEVLASGKPFNFKTATKELGRAHDSIQSTLRRMADAGTIQLEVRPVGHTNHYRIIMPDGRSTPWPNEGPPVREAPKAEEINSRRLAAERERENRRRYWLDRERAPRQRDTPRDKMFLDKATVQALQGMSA
jgi:hypothetical protein